MPDTLRILKTAGTILAFMKMSRRAGCLRNVLVEISKLISTNMNHKETDMRTWNVYEST